MKPVGDAIEELFRSSVPALRAVMKAFRIPFADHEDLVQDVFLVYLAKRAEVRSPKAWLAAVARHRCRQYWDTLRRAAEEPLAPDEGIVHRRAAWDTASPDRTVDCRRALECLSDAARSVVIARYWLGLSAREIASATGLAESSVDPTLCRARARMKNLLVREDAA